MGLHDKDEQSIYLSSTYNTGQKYNVMMKELDTPSKRHTSFREKSQKEFEIK